MEPLPVFNSRQLTRFIESHAIAAEILHLMEDTPTVPDAAAAVGVEPEQIIKSVLFFANGDPVLVITNGLARVAWKGLADYLGVSRKKLKLAKAPQVIAVTGYQVGAVPPFGHRDRLRTVVETAVFDQTYIYGGGGEIHALLKLTTAELRRVARPEIASIAEV